MLYYSFNRYLRDTFGSRVRKIPLNAGFDCPGREGESCIYCNEKGFSRFADTPKTLEEQLTESMARVREKRRTDKFMAYFQNATSTNAPLKDLKRAYDTIGPYPDIVALAISTRPDCMDRRKLDLIESYSDEREVWVEYGMQTSFDESLRWLQRGHTHKETEAAIRLTAKRNIKIAVHVILGIPGEDRGEMLRTARRIAELPVQGVKFHLLHVLKDSELEKLYKKSPFTLPSREEYVSYVADFLEELPEDRVILRLVSDAEEGYLVAPDWMSDKMRTISLIEKELRRRGTGQGWRSGRGDQAG